VAQESNDIRDDHQSAAQTDRQTGTAEDAGEAGERFVGQWNRLVSTTNWEKGRIICQWREALVDDGAPVTAYSDEAWAQLVGGVTSQHVGRLRRVFERFGEVFDQYEGLYWSHFQAAIDWDDAEMWLEGAIRNDFSVSQMRGKRWETLGGVGEPPPDDDVNDESASRPDGDLENDGDVPREESDVATAEQAVVKSTVSQNAAETDEGDAETEAEGAPAGENAPTAARRDRLAVDVDELPDDLADAFEQFKLTIIAHRRMNWSETTPEAVIECLDALRDLTLAAPD